jgi:hypothetical protein
MGIPHTTDAERVEVVVFDQYFDIPLRGLLKGGSSILAFSACVLDEEPPDLEHRKGLYCRLTVFPCDDVLKRIMLENDATFKAWRAAYDAGSADESTHRVPLTATSRSSLDEPTTYSANSVRPSSKQEGSYGLNPIVSYSNLHLPAFRDIRMDQNYWHINRSGPYVPTHMLRPGKKWCDRGGSFFQV